MLNLLTLSASVSASNWYQLNNGGDDCTAIAGTYSFVETVNTYDNSLVGTANANLCVGGVAYLSVASDCTWQYKKIRDEPNDFCEDDQGWNSRVLQHDNDEFWTVPGQLGTDTDVFVFTVEKVHAGVEGSATSARRIQGVSKTTVGCILSFEGWAVQRDTVSQCLTQEKKRHAQLTSSSSSVDVSDVKDALAQIAKALPTWTSDTSSSSSSSSSPLPCASIAGVYQLSETVNEYDSVETGDLINFDEISGPRRGDANFCTGGISFLEIHEGCSWVYKKVMAGVHESTLGSKIAYTPHYKCRDDSGAGATGVQTYETDFCMINSVSFDDGGLDFKFAVDQVEGSANAPVVIFGVLERFVGLRFPGSGCDLTFEGWRVARTELTPCHDYCYAVPNGDFSEGYFGFSSQVEKATPGEVPAIGLPVSSKYAVASKPSLLNPLFSSTPCDGLCLVTSLDVTISPIATIIWSSWFPSLGDKACCPSQTYIVHFDASNVGSFAGETLAIKIAEVFTPSTPWIGIAGSAALSTPTVTPSKTWISYKTDPFSVITSGAAVQIVEVNSNNNLLLPLPAVASAIAIDNIRISCFGGLPPAP